MQESGKEREKAEMMLPPNSPAAPKPLDLDEEKIEEPEDDDPFADIFKIFNRKD